MFISRNDKISILKEYDSFLDNCHEVPLKMYSNNIVKVIDDVGYNIFKKDYELIDGIVLNNIFNKNIIKKEIGLMYIKNPDFEVQAYHYNPVYNYDFYDVTSLSQAAYITKTFDCYFELDNNDIIDRVLEPENYKGSLKPREKFVELIETINHRKIEKNDLIDFIDYLDNDLLKISLRISKVLVAPGVYNVVEDFVPVYSSTYNEKLGKLYSKFLRVNLRTPSEDENKFLKSEAFRLACDSQLKDNEIIKNPNSTEVLYGFEDSYNKEIEKHNYIFSNQNRIVITDWNKYKLKVKKIYGVEWNDDYVIPVTYNRDNIWNEVETTCFDNRTNYPLKEQRKVYRK